MNIGSNWTAATCAACGKESLWLRELQGDTYYARMVYPLANSRHPPADLPENCIKIYTEAASVAALSPRSAAALLRLCIELLCDYLNAEGKSINEKIGFLVKKGMPVQIQQALDTVRVIGNNAVHPGELSIDEDPALVDALFKLVDLIVDNQITQPRMVEELFSNLPERAKNGVIRRDGAKDAAQ